MDKKKDLIKLLRAFIKHQENEKKFYQFKNIGLTELKKLLSKYIYLGGKFSDKYKLNTPFYIKPNKLKYLDDNNIIYSPIKTMENNVIKLLYDISKGKIKLKPIKHFKKNELDKLLALIKKYVETDSAYINSGRKLEKLMMDVSGSQSYYKAHSYIYKTMLEILEGNNNTTGLLS